MSLSDELRRLAELPGATEPQRAARPTAPSGWEPGVKYEPSGAMTVTAPPSGPMDTEDEWRAAVEALGLVVPESYRVRLVEARFDPASWTREAQGEDAVTRPVWRYRFAVEPALRTVNVDELLASIRTPKKPTPSAIDAPVYVVALADMQIGKPDGDGTAGTVRRVLDAHARALARFRDLRKRGKAGEVVIVVAGDCIEGTESQGSRLLARLDCDVTTQVRIYRRLLAEIVTDYADKADRVRVAVVPGNHDEAKRVGDKMATNYTDSWALEGAASVADALDIAGYGDRVAWIMPSYDELTVTLDVAGTTLGVLHGHQTRGKMDTWLAAQAQGRYAIGTADLIISGHYHHLRVQQLGPTTWIQTPALDGGSLWWRHSGHTDTPPGMVTLLAGGGAWESLEIV
jgi:predicted phosphodiesterase